MIVINVHDALALLPELDFPVLLIGVSEGDVVSAIKVRTPDEFEKMAEFILGMSLAPTDQPVPHPFIENALAHRSRGVELIITSEAGFDPRKERAA